MPMGKSHHVKAHSQNFESPGLQYHQPQANLLVAGAIQYAQGQHPKGAANVMPVAAHHPQYHHARRDRLNDSQLREKQDKQLEDLNETLQRLAREKYTKNVPGGAGGLQGRKKNRNATNTSDKSQMIGESQYMVAGFDAMFSQLQGFDKFSAQNSGLPQHAKDIVNTQKKKGGKGKKKQMQGMDLMQQKLESQQRNAMIMGDPLVNQRLQGVKQQAQKTPSQSQNTPNQNQQTPNRATAGQIQQWHQKSTPIKSPIDSPPGQIEHQMNAQRIQQTNSYLQQIPSPVSEHTNQQISSQTQNMFKIHMQMIEQSNKGATQMNPRIESEMKQSPERIHDHPGNSAIMNSSSVQQIQRGGGIKISSEEPLILRNNNIVMQYQQYQQAPVSFRQSTDSSGPQQAYRNSNLIGPEKILNQSIAIESKNSQLQSNQQQHFHTLNRFNTQFDQQPQQHTPISSQNEPPNGGMQTPFTQSKQNLKNTTHQSIWANESLQNFNQQGPTSPINQTVEQQLKHKGPIHRSSRLLASDGSPLPANNILQTPPVMPHKNLKVLQIDNQKQFSSVIEDVEMEAQTSPLRKKPQDSHLSIGLTGPSFEIQRATKDSMERLHNNHDVMSSRHGTDLDHRMQTETSKQELISEIKYHLNQEKEDMRALAAAQANGGNQDQVHNRSRDNSGKYFAPNQTATDIDLYDQQQIVHGQFLFSNQPSEAYPRSPQFAAIEHDQHGADQTAQSFMPSREAHSIGPSQQRGDGNQQQAFHMILNQASRMNETMNNMGQHMSPGQKNLLQATFGKVCLATQQDFAGMGARKSPNNMNNQRGGIGINLMAVNARDSSQKLPLLIRQSPANVGLVPATALRGGHNDVHLMRASMRDSQQVALQTHPGADQGSLDDHGNNAGKAYGHKRTTLDYDIQDTQNNQQRSPNNAFIPSDPTIDLSTEGGKTGKPLYRNRNNHSFNQQIPPNMDTLNPQNIEEQKLILALKQGRMSRNKAIQEQEKIKVHMSHVFSARSQDQDTEVGRNLNSLTDNVQIIHPGIHQGEKFLTYTYSGSPSNIKNGPQQSSIKQHHHQDGNENYQTISQSKQSQRNTSSINRHYKKQQNAIMVDNGVDHRKFVQKTNTQRLGSDMGASVVGGAAQGHLNQHLQQQKQQQQNEKIIQTQLKDLSGQVSVSKMLTTDGQVCLEYPQQQPINGRQSNQGNKKGRVQGKFLGESPRRPGGDPSFPTGSQSHRGASKQGPVSRNETLVAKTNQQNQGTISSSNQPQRKTFNASPNKEDRNASSIRQDSVQAQIKPPRQLQSSRPGTPTVVEPGDQSSEAPENVYNLRLGFRIPRDNYSFCHEYVQFKGQNKLPKECRNLFTSRSYQKGEQQFPWSTRLYLSRECALSEDRRRYPVLIVNLDGAVGMWDDFKKNHYVLRPKVVEGLIQLSYDFRLVAVSSHRQRHICRVIQALMNIPPGSQPTGGSGVDASNNNNLLHLVFDAVYKLNSQNPVAKFTNAVKNIDEIHFDLTQPLTDMQFQKHKKKRTDSKSQGRERDHEEVELGDKYQTFWETREYRPCKKVLILTTNRMLFKSCCYSFDYNYLFQARKFMHEESKKAPIVLQMPHMRLCPKVSFDIVLQTIFTLQNVAQALSCKKQDAQKCVDGEMYFNPHYSGFEICKKLISTKLRHQMSKMKRDGFIKGLRVFDQKKDIFVDLELIDFGAAYKFLKNYMFQRKSDWIVAKKYYLLYKPEQVEITPLKLKQNLKVTFEESPDIRRIGDEQRDKAGSSLNGRAGATTHDSSKSDKFSFVKNQYISEEAKNLYNALMIRNYKIQQEINTYARHHRIQQQKKIEKKKEQDLLDALQEQNQTPIVIYDSDKDDESRYQEPKLRSSLKEYPTHKMNLEKERMEQEQMKNNNKKSEKEKKYAFKYRVLQIRMNEDVIDEGDMYLKQYAVINMRLNPTTQYALRVPGQVNDHTQYGSMKEGSQAICATPRYVQNQDYLQHNANVVADGHGCSNFLIDLLSKKQTKISYSTNQEMHLKNNLNQLVDGEQQYKDQQSKLTQDEKEQIAIQNQLEKANDHKQNNNDKQENYLDKI